MSVFCPDDQGAVRFKLTATIKVVGDDERRRFTPKCSKYEKNFFHFFTPWETKGKKSIFQKVSQIG